MAREDHYNVHRHSRGRYYFSPNGEAATPEKPIKRKARPQKGVVEDDPFSKGALLEVVGVIEGIIIMRDADNYLHAVQKTSIGG